MWFVTHRNAEAVARRACAFEADPSVARVAGLLWNAVRA
jgi:hypothetical protein